jgi:hypothetical protein
MDLTIIILPIFELRGRHCQLIKLHTIVLSFFWNYAGNNAGIANLTQLIKLHTIVLSVFGIARKILQLALLI